MLLWKDLSIQELSYSVKNSLNLARRTNSNILRREIFYLHSVKKKFMGHFFRLSTDFSRPSHYCWHRSKLLRQDNFWCAVSVQAVRLGRQYRSSTKRYLEITSPTRICSQLFVWSNGNLPCQGHGRERTGARFQLERFSLRGVTPGRISLRVLRGTHTGLYCL